MKLFALIMMANSSPLSKDAPVSTPAPRRIQHGGRPNWKEDGSREVGNGASKYSGLTRLAYHYNREFSASQHHAYGCNCMMVGGLPLVDTNFGPPVDELDGTCKKLKECYKCVMAEFGPNCTPEKREYDFFVRGQDVLAGNRAGSCERALFECDHHYAKQLTSTINSFDMKFNFFVSGFDPISDPAICTLAHQAVKESQFFNGQPSFSSPMMPSSFQPGNGPQQMGAPLISSDRPLFVASSAEADYDAGSFGGVREILTSQPHNMQCCGGPESPYMIYDANMKKCCSDGTVRSSC